MVNAVCRHHLHPEIWPLLPVRHQGTQQQPSTLDSTAPCFHLGRTTRYHLHSRVVLERRRLSPSLSISVVHSTIFAPAPAFRHPASAKHHSACRRSSFSSCCCRILHRFQSSSPSSDCHFLYCAYFVDHCCFCFISATSSTIAASASGKNLSTGSIVQLLLLLLLLLAIHEIINVVENIIIIATILGKEEDDTWNERSSQRRQKMIDYFVPLLMVAGIADCKHGNENGRENGAEEGCRAATSAKFYLFIRTLKSKEEEEKVLDSIPPSELEKSVYHMDGHLNRDTGLNRVFNPNRLKTEPDFFVSGRDRLCDLGGFRYRYFTGSVLGKRWKNRYSTGCFP
ncbi:hypothetical protein LXL04_024277 [Taraxacum kok-saghyz]